MSLVRCIFSALIPLLRAPCQHKTLNARHWLNRLVTRSLNTFQVQTKSKVTLPLSKMSNISRDSSTTITTAKKTNRLALEHSPYLRQHMHNPVDWYPWGAEAFDKAKNENKLIFLSVGYSTCHWCHVMEKESFENESIATIMNRHFVNIKVDREERPDVDKVYMTFITSTTRHGGWPMSVFLTPDLKPITGGTYFPPQDTPYQSGFSTVLNRVQDAWANKRDVLMETGEDILEQLNKGLRDLSSSDNDVPELHETVSKCYKQYASSYESQFGGWCERPKFPQPSNFNVLLHMYTRDSNSPNGKHALNMCLNTLTKMAQGGIYDHVGDGFARYSTDEKWHVPHFEKMLYDQAQLVNSYCDAFQITRDSFYSDIVHGILRYVSRDLSHDSGGFYSAEDADSLPTADSQHKREGAFYVWTYDELKSALAPLESKCQASHFDVYAYHFNVKQNGNVSAAFDPHEEFTNQNVLINFGSLKDTSEKFQIAIDLVQAILHECKNQLLMVRSQRPRPQLDTKIISAWNGLMIAAYARAGHALNNCEYTERAVKAAQFIKQYLYKDNMLLRSCYVNSDGQVDQLKNPIEGFLEDYAFLVKGLIQLHHATLNSKWLQWAETLQEKQNELFWDAECGAYFQSPASNSNLIMRIKDDQDGAEPSGNSVSAHNLIRIAAYLDRDDLRKQASQIFQVFAERLKRIPIALPEMTSALISYHDAPTHIFIAGSCDDPATTALLDVVRVRLLPNRYLLAVCDGPNGRSELLYQRSPVISRLKPINGRAAAYVCRHYTCSLPVTDPNDLLSLLSENEK